MNLSLSRGARPVWPTWRAVVRADARSAFSSSCWAAYVSSQRRRAAALCSKYDVNPPPNRLPPSPSTPKWLGSRSTMTAHTRSRNTRSWLATSTTPGRSSRNASRNSIASSSRWLVGSSRITHSGCRATSAASASRVRSPPESSSTSRAGSIAARPRWCAARSARRSASHAPWYVAQASASAYWSAIDGVVEVMREVLQAAYGVMHRRKRGVEHVTNSRADVEGEVLRDVADLRWQGHRS